MLRNNEDEGQKEINSVGRAKVQKEKERKQLPAEGMLGKRSEKQEF